MYGKLQDGALLYAPKIIKEDGKQIINPNAKTLIDRGYKEIVRDTYPIDEAEYISEYSEDDTAIYIKWVEVAALAEE